MKLTIRGITKADYDHLVSVLDQWWGGPSGQRAHPVFFYEFGDQALIAERDDEVVGFLLGFLSPGEPSYGYVHFVGIHPDFRRRGVGQQLYAAFSERCQQAGATSLKAIAAKGDEGAQRFHEALGFATEVDGDYAGPGRARVVFRKKLGEPKE